ncbi:lactam utilization protein LamB [Salipaludibacillus keqinensis]|uniref:5-oxoprolinase subunit A n=1 Tax=Salipaludibacillus keqinensis TaxID=2045207 RepID=A0A323T5D7_9BACI|nr:5-oxoprolinase subunit PxpA [Salipaludibacillus keqinensis]PYZ91631.1 lactam utilization protein LamB [Salipaludibacillus keqinensis]
MKEITIDLNSDIGESFGLYTIGQDELVLDYITSANIACGYHAGDHNVMNHTVKMAIEKGVAIGAHPGLPDLIGFGRRKMEVTREDVYNMVIYQVSSLQGFVHIHGGKLNHVKPHGALFNMAAKDPVTAQAIASAVADVDPSLVLYGLAGSELIRAGRESGLTVAEEIFADRTYQPDGTLTPRTDQDAVIHDADKAKRRVLRMVTEGIVKAVDGTEIPINADTLCVHGDEQQALLFVQELKQMLLENGVSVKAVDRL